MASGPVPSVICSVVSDSLWLQRLWPSSSSVHGILQARILEWVAIFFSRGSSQPRGWTWISHIAGRFFLPSEPPGKPPLGWKSRSSDRFDFIYCRWWLQPSVVFWKESYDKPRQHIKKPSHHFANKDPYSQIYGFSNSHVQTWELDHIEGWASRELMLSNCGVGEDSWEPLG